ncbi:adenylate cyclase [Thermomonospora echinospora]|uniref:Adenylate cyclase n=1 Tax=Thermomonospora echinospora TaxID=1992 RepID=A0A1H6CW56_9ACTN|nr:adenylate/guanylate cyclase domain-containing protein [Thermomonospora echinospora]SEG77047.1 adenylate cyclase [Thermomonospora echinospora]
MTGAPPDERQIEEKLLGGPLRHTRAEVEALSGIRQDYGLRIWRALGFPTPATDEVAFTDADVAALREIRELLDTDLVDEEMVLQLARGVGQTMGRLAGWLGGTWLRRLGEELPADEPVTEELVFAALAATEELRPRFERLLLHGWRRQLAAAGLRSLSTTAAATADPVGGVALMAAGFADVVSFTRLSRAMEGQELAEFVERFEATAAEVIADLGGQLVKTLGDEVFFVADDAAVAAEIGLTLAGRHETDPGFPRLRVGLAQGEVILRLGDFFGTPVNLAARLTSIAYPGAVLVDGELATALAADDDRYDISALRPRPLQGLGRVRPRLLRRRSPHPERT